MVVVVVVVWWRSCRDDMKLVWFCMMNYYVSAVALLYCVVGWWVRWFGFVECLLLLLLAQHLHCTAQPGQARESALYIKITKPNQTSKWKERFFFTIENIMWDYTYIFFFQLSYIRVLYFCFNPFLFMHCILQKIAGVLLCCCSFSSAVCLSRQVYTFVFMEESKTVLWF